MPRSLHFASLICLLSALGAAGAQQAPPAPPSSTPAGSSLTAVPASANTTPAEPSKDAASEKAKPPAEAPAKPKPKTPAERWLTPAEHMTADLDGAVWRLKRPMHAMALARLAATWWKQDNTRARAWMAQAVDEVTSAGQAETEAEQAQRFQAGRVILSEASPLAPDLRQRLVDALANASSNTSPAGPVRRLELAAELATAAARTAATAEEMGRGITESLQYGVTDEALQAIIALRGANPERADLLFSQALAQAGRTSNVDEVQPFVDLITPSPAWPAYPQEWGRQSLDMIARVLLQIDPGSYDRCDLAAALPAIVPLYSSGMRETVEAVVNQCAQQGGGSVAGDWAALKNRDLQTADDYLSAAANAKTPTVRASLKVQASQRAEHEDADDRPERALTIFDAMTPEERSATENSWSYQRAELAIRIAVRLIGKGDPQGGVRIIDTSPPETEVHVAVGVLEKMGKAPSGLADQIKRIAMRELRRHAPENPIDFVRLINIYLRGHDANAPYALREIMAELDLWKAKERRYMRRREIYYAPLFVELAPLPFAREITELDSDQVAAAMQALRTDGLRTQCQLTMVRLWLRRYESELGQRQQQAAEKSERRSQK